MELEHRYHKHAYQARRHGTRRGSRTSGTPEHQVSSGHNSSTRSANAQPPQTAQLALAPEQFKASPQHIAQCSWCLNGETLAAPVVMLPDGIVRRHELAEQSL
eukprot:scaffold287950_cov33-Tisochrysis_lutea.AAC.1